MIRVILYFYVEPDFRWVNIASFLKAISPVRLSRSASCLSHSRSLSPPPPRRLFYTPQRSRLFEALGRLLEAGRLSSRQRKKGRRLKEIGIR